MTPAAADTLVAAIARDEKATRIQMLEDLRMVKRANDEGWKQFMRMTRR